MSYSHNEVYVLLPSRDSSMARLCLERYMPVRKPCCDEYEVPEYAEKAQHVFRQEAEILSYLEEHPNESYGLYWNNAKSDNGGHIMLFYTVDGGLILGIIDLDKDPRITLSELKIALKCEFGYLGSEERPPNNVEDFKERCRALMPEHN